MYKILTLNAISDAGLNKLPADKFVISDKEENPDGIILRSFDMHNMDIPATVMGIARAGAGTNNIPVDKCAEKGIVVFNTPGANANAVKELVLTGIFVSARNVIQGVEWAKSLKGKENVPKLVEKGKSQFVGPEIKGKTLGVIGLGAIGVLVANAARNLGMEVIGYDPYLSVDAAWSLSSSVIKADSMEAVVRESDYITIHVPLNASTKGMFNDKLFEETKDGARLLNFARGELVDIPSLKRAIESGKIVNYVTDFPSEDLYDIENVILIPHLGASTPESEENCAEMASVEIREFLKYGNIKNSVNYPECILPYTGKCRISIAHKNIPNMLGAIATAVAKQNLNIDNMINKSKGDWAYSLVDIDDLCGKQDSIINALEEIEGVVRARIVCCNC